LAGLLAYLNANYFRYETDGPRGNFLRGTRGPTSVPTIFVVGHSGIVGGTVKVSTVVHSPFPYRAHPNMLVGNNYDGRK
jgi:hypothetical protein